MYYKSEKEAKTKRVASTIKTTGKASLGGPWVLVDHDGIPRTDASYKGGYQVRACACCFCTAGAAACSVCCMLCVRVCVHYILIPPSAAVLRVFLLSRHLSQRACQDREGVRHPRGQGN